jgi:hypothetical protein
MTIRIDQVAVRNRGVRGHERNVRRRSGTIPRRIWRLAKSIDQERARRQYQRERSIIYDRHESYPKPDGVKLVVEALSVAPRSLAERVTKVDFCAHCLIVTTDDAGRFDFDTGLSDTELTELYYALQSDRNGACISLSFGPTHTDCTLRGALYNADVSLGRSAPVPGNRPRERHAYRAGSLRWPGALPQGT